MSPQKAGLLLIALLFAIGAAPDAGDDPGPLPPALRAGEHLRESQRLLGDPGGLRSRLEAQGLSLSLFFNHQTGARLRGGARSGSDLRHSGSYDFLSLADFGELAGLPGAMALIHAKGNYNRNINPRVAALSDPIDDADFDEAIYLVGLWAEQAVWQSRVRLRLGYQDQQTSFDRNAVANSEDLQFMAQFLDNSPIVPLKIGLSAALYLRPFERFEFALATADADNEIKSAGFDTFFDGLESLMGYFEGAWSPELSSPRGPLPGRYRIGAVLDNQKKLDFRNGRRKRGHWAFYLSFDQMLYRERPEGLEGLSVFARWGHADEEVNRIEQFWSAGVQYRGLLPGRDGDVFGFASYQALGSDPYRRRVDPDFRRETGFETYYRIRLTPWLDLSPDAQWIIDPGGADERDAFVLALRVRVSF